MVNEVEVENVNAEPGKEYVYTIEHEVNDVNLSQDGCVEREEGLCTYTHLSHAHFSGAHTLCILHTPSCVCTCTHGSSRVKKVFVANVSYLSISPSSF